MIYGIIFAYLYRSYSKVLKYCIKNRIEYKKQADTGKVSACSGYRILSFTFLIIRQSFIKGFKIPIKF